MQQDMPNPVQPPVPQPPTAEAFRHRAEVPLIVFGLVTLTVVTVAVVWLFLWGVSVSPWFFAILGCLLAPVIGYISVKGMYWMTISNGVEVTERQLPELYQVFVEMARGMGLDRDSRYQGLPRLYVVNGNGTLNAFASKCRVRSGYVVIFSDVVDVAYEQGDFDAVRFVLGHELGHIKCGHVSFWRMALSSMMTIVGLGPTMSRAQEYTADRVGAYYAPNGATKAIFLFAGKNVHRRVDFEEYLASIDTHKDGFWLLFANFFSGHAVGFRRMKALARTRTEGWNVHGRML